MDRLPPQLLTEIFLRFNKRNEYGELMYDVNALVKLMKVSVYFNDVLSMDFIWKHLCKQFSDFERLRFMHEEQELTWRVIYEKRMTDILHTEEFRVGYQDEPTNIMLFQIKGNGHVRMSTDFITGESLDPQANEWTYYCGNSFRMNTLGNALSGFCKTKHPDDILLDEDTECFVNMSGYSPFLLLLSSSGNVYEFIFERSRVFGDNDHSMRLIAIPKMQGEKAILVKATPIANYAITNKGRIFAWTTIHTGTKNIIYTEPLLIGQTNPNQRIMDIIYGETYTEFVTKEERMQQLNESLYSTLVLKHDIFN